MTRVKRPLVWAALGLVCALLLAHYVAPYAWLPYAAAVCAALALAALPFKKFRFRAGVAILFAAAGIGFAWYWGYTALMVTPASAFVGEKRSVTVRVGDYPDIYDEYSRVEAVSIDAEVPHVRMLLYDYDGGFGELRPGDEVEMPLKLLSAGTFYGEESDYYLSNGIQLRGYTTGDYAVAGRWALSWLYFPKEIAKLVREQALACFPEDVAPLMKALLTGDRTELYADDELYSALRVSGFIHIVAVSGMHVAFLIGLLRIGTGRRRLTAFIGIPVVVVFMAMIGFKPSVVRAGLMQILLLIAPLLRREEDPPTSLSAVAILLLLANPISVASVSLQLSFAAMAGLILVTPRLFDFLAYDDKGESRLSKGLWGRALFLLCDALAASVGAIVFTTPLLALHFGYVPLYSVLTNLLCLWAMSDAFLCGYFVCLLGLVWPAGGQALGWLVGWLPRYTVFVVERVAKLPYAAFYTRNNLGGWWLVFVYLLFGGTYALRGEDRYRPVIPVCVSLVTLCALTFTMRREIAGGLELAAIDVGQGQSIAALTEYGSVLIDCGSVGAADNAGDLAAEFLLRNGRSRIDLLLLTHFDSDHINGVKRLMSRVDVRRLAIPKTDPEGGDVDAILASCVRHGTEVYFISENTDFTVDTLELKVYAPLATGSSNDEGLIVYGDYGSFEFLVTGDAAAAVERRLVSGYDLGDMEVLIVGHHGSRYSTSDELLDDITVETAIISVGAGNSYGHPAQEVIDRLLSRGIEVYRTDLDGTVRITVGSDDGEEYETGI